MVEGQNAMITGVATADTGTTKALNQNALVMVVATTHSFTEADLAFGCMSFAGPAFVEG